MTEGRKGLCIETEEEGILPQGTGVEGQAFCVCRKEGRCVWVLQRRRDVEKAESDSGGKDGRTGNKEEKVLIVGYGDWYSQKYAKSVRVNKKWEIR